MKSKLWYIPTIYYYALMRMNGLKLHTTEWLNLPVLNKRSQRKFLTLLWKAIWQYYTCQNPFQTAGGMKMGKEIFMGGREFAKLHLPKWKKTTHTLLWPSICCPKFLLYRYAEPNEIYLGINIMFKDGWLYLTTYPSGLLWNLLRLIHMYCYGRLLDYIKR